jgi:addiction module RelE/StbE family toxin
MKVRYSRRATSDLAKIFAYIAKDNPAAAARVVQRIEQVVAHLEHAPESGALTNKPGIHRLPVVSHPYLIFYEVFQDEIAIVHIRHGARRPWAGPR